MSNPLDGATKDEIAHTVKAVLATFTTQYVKHYGIALVKKTEQDAMKEVPPLKLLKRENEWTDDLKVGYLVKEGAVRKNWKKRWFIVRHDYSVDYFTDEKSAGKPKPKPKGTMHLAGYHVVENIGEGLLKTAKDLAEKMGVDMSQLPKPKEYPEHCFEVHHSRRRCYFIQCASQEEKAEWVEMFKTCCRNSWGLKNRDPVHTTAFHRAVRETRWSLGRWGWWSYGGSEEQILSDVVSDEIEYKTLGKIYSKISGPWVVRNTIRNSVLKTIDSIVSAGVNPAWAAMAKTVEELRPKMEPTIKDLADPLGKAKAEVREKIKDAVTSALDPIFEQHVTPHIGKIVTIIKSPVVDSYQESYGIFHKNVTEFSETADLKDPSGGFKKLGWVSRSYWTMRPATEKLDVMYEPLWLLREIFSEIWPWSIIWKTQDSIRDVTDRAIYTFEVKLKEELQQNADAGKEAIDKTVDQVKEWFDNDSSWHATQAYIHILKSIIMPPLNAVANPAVNALLDPLDSAIPDAMKQFIDIGDEFQQLLETMVGALIEVVLRSG